MDSVLLEVELLMILISGQQAEGHNIDSTLMRQKAKRILNTVSV
jgi:hypothetical protein